MTSNLGIWGQKQNNRLQAYLMPEYYSYNQKDWDSLYGPYIPSPDWSKNLIVPEGDFAHGTSKFVAGNAAFFLITMGASSVASGTSNTSQGASCASKCAIGPDDFVHVTDAAGAKSITTSGLNPEFSGYVTKWKYIENVDDARIFETKLYRQELWPSKIGKYDDGAIILKIDGPFNPLYKGPRTNWTNGVPQWEYQQTVPTEYIQEIIIAPK
jgi:hypothetical protein